ncbi:hypothetical protein [Mycetocola sp. JXN-3]|uniref:hypothetical protein n=1 Tax=Mycetocola sp. JXN-3 TaxID=2116510 RepID=UPI00165D1400|nr:hypothetical protein [Mycetocola sp. JXN-3]
MSDSSRADRAAIVRYLRVVQDSRNGLDERTASAFERLTPAQLDLLVERLAGPSASPASASSELTRRSPAPGSAGNRRSDAPGDASDPGFTRESAARWVQRRLLGGASARDVRGTARVTGAALALFAVVIGIGAAIAITTEPQPMAGPGNPQQSVSTEHGDPSGDLGEVLRRQALEDQQTDLDY